MSPLGIVLITIVVIFALEYVIRFIFVAEAELRGYLDRGMTNNHYTIGWLLGAIVWPFLGIAVVALTIIGALIAWKAAKDIFNAFKK